MFSVRGPREVSHGRARKHSRPSRPYAPDQVVRLLQLPPVDGVSPAGEATTGSLSLRAGRRYSGTPHPASQQSTSLSLRTRVASYEGILTPDIYFSCLYPFLSLPRLMARIDALRAVQQWFPGPKNRQPGGLEGWKAKSRMFQALEDICCVSGPFYAPTWPFPGPEPASTVEFPDGLDNTPQIVLMKFAGRNGKRRTSRDATRRAGGGMAQCWMDWQR